jgi:hypothetical protein
MVRLQKLVDKLVNSSNKGPDKIIEYFVDIKNEIENSSSIKLDIDYYMDQVSSELKKNGIKSPKKELEAIKKKIKKQDKKVKHHALYVAETMYLEGYEMNDLDEEMMFQAKHHKHKHHTDEDKKDEDEVVLPSLLVYGVTVSLCGFFLMCLPIPACKEWGSKMVMAGITACANSLTTEIDKNKEKEKK